MLPKEVQINKCINLPSSCTRDPHPAAENMTLPLTWHNLIDLLKYFEFSLSPVPCQTQCYIVMTIKLSSLKCTLDQFCSGHTTCSSAKTSLAFFFYSAYERFGKWACSLNCLKGWDTVSLATSGLHLEKSVAGFQPPLSSLPNCKGDLLINRACKPIKCQLIPITGRYVKVFSNFDHSC